jgi:transposase-like protein
MDGRPVISPERKIRIVMSVLAREVTIADAARREKVAEQSISRWKADFVRAGQFALSSGRSGPSRAASPRRWARPLWRYESGRSTEAST